MLAVCGVMYIADTYDEI